MSGPHAIAVGVLAALAAACAAIEPDSQAGASGEFASRLATGGALYKSHCARCHGQGGRGSGTVPALNDVARRTDEQLRKIIMDGVSGSMMAGWRGRLTAVEIEAVVAFLRHGLTLEG